VIYVPHSDRKLKKNQNHQRIIENLVFYRAGICEVSLFPMEKDGVLEPVYPPR
jgi:hypothetical protein